MKNFPVKQTLQFFWRFTKPNPFLFWYATIGAVVAAAFTTLIPPFIISRGFDKLQYLAANNQPITVEALLPYFLAFLVTMLASIILWRTEAWAAWTYQIKGIKRIRDFTFHHLQQMDLDFFNNRFSGALVSQTNKFSGAYENVSANLTWNVIPTITLFVGSLIILAFQAPVYAAAFLVIATGHMVIVYRLMSRQAPYNRRLSSSESETTAKLADSITNISTVRAFAGEDQEEVIFRKQSKKARTKYFELMDVQMRNEVISQTNTSFMDVAAFAFGLLGVIYFNAPVGVLYLTVTYTLAISQNMWQFMFVLKRLNRDFGDAADMTEILQLEPKVKDPANPEKSRIQNGSIDFKNVTFFYQENKTKPLFKELDLAIGSGEKVGLVGHSGGGKTTITKLLLRFMDIQKGEILIDDQNIAAISQKDLRSHIAYVPQEPLLFHRTLLDNIRYGKPHATKEEAIQAAKLAHAHEFIKDLPDGYETLVGERGVKLSGGQRQRVAIARAMLKDAPILVLDEATSALDSESEALIQDALWKLMKGRTTIVIAHRLSTIQKMDRIIVMDKGQVLEEGTHKELVSKKGVYGDLWNHQSGGFIEE